MFAALNRQLSGSLHSSFQFTSKTTLECRGQEAQLPQQRLLCRLESIPSSGSWSCAHFNSSGVLQTTSLTLVNTKNLCTIGVEGNLRSVALTTRQERTSAVPYKTVCSGYLPLGCSFFVVSCFAAEHRAVLGSNRLRLAVPVPCCFTFASGLTTVIGGWRHICSKDAPLRRMRTAPRRRGHPRARVRQVKGRLCRGQNAALGPTLPLVCHVPRLTPSRRLCQPTALLQGFKLVLPVTFPSACAVLFTFASGIVTAIGGGRHICIGHAPPPGGKPVHGGALRIDLESAANGQTAARDGRRALACIARLGPACRGLSATAAGTSPATAPLEHLCLKIRDV